MSKSTAPTPPPFSTCSHVLSGQFSFQSYFPCFLVFLSRQQDVNQRLWARHPPSQPTSPPLPCTRGSPEPPPGCAPLTVPPGRLAEVEAVLGAAVREHLPGGAEHPAGRQPLTDGTQRPQRSRWGRRERGGTWRRRGIVPAGPRRLPPPPPPPLRPPPPPARRPRPPWIPSPAPRAPFPGPPRQQRARRGGTGRLWGDGGGNGDERAPWRRPPARRAGRCSRRGAILWGQPVTAPRAQRGDGTLPS